MHTPSKTPPKSPLLGAPGALQLKSDSFTTINGRKYINTTPIKYSTSLYRRIDISNVDYILVSHIDKGQSLALPTLIRDLGFRGEILMTLPLRQIGTEMLNEFYKMNESRVDKGVLGEVWKSNNLQGGLEMNDPFSEKYTHGNNPFSKITGFNQGNSVQGFEEEEIMEKEGLYLEDWLELGGEEDIDEMISRVRTVNFGEELTLRGGLKVLAKASGYHIGASTWSLQYGTENLLVIDSYSFHKYKHSIPLDLSIFKTHNKILATDCFNQDTNMVPKGESEVTLSTSEICINRFVSSIKKIVKEYPEDSIIMPVRNSLFLLDLIDILHFKISQIRKIHVISDIFMSTINYSNANVDYLNKPLQRKIFGKTPFLPINVDKLEEKDKIEFFKDMYSFVDKIKHTKNYMSFMTPSLYIVVDSTLRLGYSAKLIEIMNSEVGSGTILFSDPFLKTSDIFYPLYRSNKLRVVTQPFNMNDNCETLLEIFKKEAKNATIILPTKYKYCLKNDPELKSRTMFLDDNSSIKFELDTNSGLYVKPQLYN